MWVCAGGHACACVCYTCTWCPIMGWWPIQGISTSYHVFFRSTMTLTRLKQLLYGSEEETRNFLSWCSDISTMTISIFANTVNIELNCERGEKRERSLLFLVPDRQAWVLSYSGEEGRERCFHIYQQLTFTSTQPSTQCWAELQYWYENIIQSHSFTSPHPKIYSNMWHHVNI